MTKRILLILSFVYGLTVSAQIRSQFFVDGEESEVIQLKDSTELFNYLNSVQTSWVKKGHYFSGIDSIRKKDKHLFIYLHKGKRFNIELQGSNRRDLVSLMERRLNEYSNKGYPFATLQTDSLKLRDNILTGDILIDPGPEVRYDSAFFFGKTKTSVSYISRLLDIVPGDLFSERNYLSIPSKIERSTFLSLKQPTDLSFKDNKAKVFLDVDESNSNTFQGVLGLLQQQDGKATVVGSLELDVQNLFKSGKQFRFFWERFSEQSQKLDLFYKHPFFLDSKLSPSFRFGLLKQDTTFLTRLLGIGVHTFITSRTELFLEFERENGTLLSTEIETISNLQLADFTKNIYNLKISKGLESSLSTFKNGIAWNISLSGGTKIIDRNLSIPINFYDTLESNTDFYRFEGDFFYQLTVFKRQAFYQHIQAATLRNSELLTNELYRLGGLSTVRGFNERSLFAENYLLSRIEFRSFFENNSYAYAFYDQLFFSQNSIYDQPFGLGVGFVLATSAGQFSFALAIGDSDEQPLSFSTIKAHFGYISRF